MKLNIGGLMPRLPLIQGGMGVGISLSGLAGAVAAAGGIGMISTAQIGFTEPEFDAHPLETNLRMVGEQIRRARKKAAGGILGVNIMVATQNYARYVQEAVKAGIDLIISGAGLPLALPSLTKGSGVRLVPIVSSAKAAGVILRMWDKKDGTVPDALVMEGPLAGGHLGFKEAELNPPDMENFCREIVKTKELLKAYEDKYSRQIPIIAAGGIADRDGVKQMEDLGADGIQAATRFVTTEECDAHENYKKAYIDCAKEDIVIVKSPVGMPGRAIRNPFIERIEREPERITRCHGCIISCNPKNSPYCITDALVRAARGDVDNGLLFCGANAYRENRIRTVREVIADYF